VWTQAIQQSIDSRVMGIRLIAEAAPKSPLLLLIELHFYEDLHFGHLGGGNQGEYGYDTF